MAKQIVLFTCPPPDVSLRRVRISKQSMWVTKCAAVSSPSFSISAPLRYASICCSSLATASIESNASSAKVFVKGLPLSTSEGRLMKVFSEFGEVNLVQLPIDEESGQSLGFAFIWFVKEEYAQVAVQEMNGKVCILLRVYKRYPIPSELNDFDLGAGFLLQFFDGRFIYVAIAKPGSSKDSKRTTAYKF